MMCYKCSHRRSVPGSCHSSCAHPDVFKNNNKIVVVGKEHGIKNGWFFWPINFDPVWLESCNCFEERKKND